MALLSIEISVRLLERISFLVCTVILQKYWHLTVARQIVTSIRNQVNIPLYLIETRVARGSRKISYI